MMLGQRWRSCHLLCLPDVHTLAGQTRVSISHICKDTLGHSAPCWNQDAIKMGSPVVLSAQARKTGEHLEIRPYAGQRV